MMGVYGLASFNVSQQAWSSAGHVGICGRASFLSGRGAAAFEYSRRAATD